MRSYVYGHEGMLFEQVSSTEKVQYLHHDQAGSTRLLTSSTGTVTGAYTGIATTPLGIRRANTRTATRSKVPTYTPYGGTETHTGTATTPLGYDAQLTSPDTASSTCEPASTTRPQRGSSASIR